MTNIALILDRIGHTLVVDVSPHLDGHYAGGHVTMAGLLSILAAQKFDGMVDRILHEIGDMRTLLEEGGVDSGDTRSASMKISDLQVVHDRLSQKMIELQASLEEKTDDESKALNARIWHFHVLGAEARMPELPDLSAARANATTHTAAEKANT